MSNPYPYYPSQIAPYPPFGSGLQSGFDVAPYHVSFLYDEFSGLETNIGLNPLNGYTSLTARITGVETGYFKYQITNNSNLTLGNNFNINFSNSGVDNIGSPNFPASGIYSLNIYASGQKILPNRNVEFLIDGGGATITSGSQGFITIPFAANVNSWTMIANQSGNLIVDVRRSSYASYTGVTIPPTLCLTDPPTINNGLKNQNLSVTTWGTINAGDILEFYTSGINATTPIAGIQRCNLTINLGPI